MLTEEIGMSSSSLFRLATGALFGLWKGVSMINIKIGVSDFQLVPEGQML